MDRPAVIATGSAACVLAALILLEILTVGAPPPGSPPGDGSAGGSSASAPTPEARPAGATPAAAVAPERLQSWVGTILARPIFSPSRRPGAVAAISTELPRLAAIIIDPGGARAIFASGDARAIVATAGMRVGPYLVRTVAADGVSVIGPNGAQRLRPSYDHNNARDATPDAAAPAGGSILDLLRSRVQNGDGMRGGTLPNPGASPVMSPQR